MEGFKHAIIASSPEAELPSLVSGTVGLWVSGTVG